MKLFFRKIWACILIKYFNRSDAYNKLKKELNPTPECIKMNEKEAKALQKKYAK